MDAAIPRDLDEIWLPFPRPHGVFVAGACRFLARNDALALPYERAQNSRRLGLSAGRTHPRKYLQCGQMTVLPRSANESLICRWQFGQSTLSRGLPESRRRTA
jgi:hypothetical protein